MTYLNGFGPIVFDFPYVSEELTDKSNKKIFFFGENDLIPLQSKFFPAKIFFCILEKGFLAVKIYSTKE